MILETKTDDEDEDEESNPDQDEPDTNSMQPLDLRRRRSPGFLSRTPPMEAAMPLDLTIKHEQDEPNEEDSEQGLYFLSDDSDNTTLPWNESPTNRGFSDESISSPQNPFYEEESTNQEDTSSSSDESLNSFTVIVGKDGILKTVPHGGIKTENIVMVSFKYFEERSQNRKKKTNSLAKTMLLL